MTDKPLQSVDFICTNGRPAPGLVPVSEDSGAERSASIDEVAAILDARSFGIIDYIFFRRFTDGRSSQLAAYVVDNSDEKHDESQLVSLHRQVWLQGRSPLLYVAWPTHVDVLACARGPDFWDGGDCRYNAAETLQIATDISDQMGKVYRFSALRLADGTFWEDPTNRRLADYDKSAHQLLIRAVVDADEALDGRNRPTLRRLLLLMILVKYLEDRGVFPNSAWFGRYHKGARSFFEVLKGGDPDAVERLLGYLQTKFNGDVFEVLPVSRPNS
jgi:hypothetical protein